jgi:Flp pilus assembly protein TadD
MRNILVDHARRRVAAKRGGLQRQVTLSEAVLQSQNRTIDVLVLNRALEQRPNYWLAYNALGIVLNDQGKYAAAEERTISIASERSTARRRTKPAAR